MQRRWRAAEQTVISKSVS